MWKDYRITRCSLRTVRFEKVATMLLEENGLLKSARVPNLEMGHDTHASHIWFHRGWNIFMGVSSDGLGHTRFGMVVCPLQLDSTVHQVGLQHGLLQQLLWICTTRDWTIFLRTAAT